MNTHEVKLSGAQRRRLRHRLEMSSNKCAECWEPVRHWVIRKGVPTCPVCAGTEPLGGQIERQHTL
jgi:hypothetical protein